jgi:hypothetical protein
MFAPFERITLRVDAVLIYALAIGEMRHGGRCFVPFCGRYSASISVTIPVYGLGYLNILRTDADWVAFQLTMLSAGLVRDYSYRQS